MLVFTLLARDEERRMLDRFGGEFRAYRRRLPMFVPRWGQWQQLVNRSNVAADKVE